MKKKYAIIVFIILTVSMLACLLLMHKPEKAPPEQTAAAPQTTETAQPTAQQETPPPTAAQPTAQETAQPTAHNETEPLTPVTPPITQQETAQPTAAAEQQTAPQPPAGEPQRGVYKVNACKFIRLYKKPDTSSTIVTNIPNGTMLTIKSIEKDSSGAFWGRTEFKTQSGWVQMQDMKK